MMASANDKTITEWAAGVYGADPNLIFYIGQDESHFSDVPNSSGSGASGWWQFMPDTFRSFAASARAAAPAAWAGVPTDIHDERAQALAASWGVANGHGSDWATLAHAKQQAATAPVYSRAGTAVAGAVTGAVNGTVNAILSGAHQLVGTPYQWGGTTTRGFDCSGFVQYVFGLAGVHVPRTSQQQAAAATPVAASDARAGDLVFFDNNSHVGIYLGNGKMVDAPHTGSSVGVRDVYAGATYGRVAGVTGSANSDVGFYGPMDAWNDGHDLLNGGKDAVTGTYDALKGLPEAVTGAAGALGDSVQNAAQWIGKETLVAVLVGGVSLIGGLLIVWGTITALGGDPKKTAETAVATTAKAAA